MGELKQHQPPMTIDEQVENLKSIGLIVNDEEYAKKILNDISYQIDQSIQLKSEAEEWKLWRECYI